jgi:serine kinase of HPr protein (carbohydrate metabolism regulator)
MTGPLGKPSLRIEEFVDAKELSLAIEPLTLGVSLDRSCSDADVASPGLALAGFVDRFPEGRLQVFGETEMTSQRKTTKLTKIFSAVRGFGEFPN